MRGAAAAASAAEEAEPELSIDSVSRVFGGVPAVDRCSLAVGRGEIVALLGPSGCGKSTLLNMIAGFETPDEGTIRLRGHVLNAVPPHRRNTAMVFQHYAIFPHLTVGRNIGYGLRARRVTGEAARERVDEMLALLKLGGLENRYPAQLSGGQRQRVAIARALAIRPDVLLLDEAFSALDRNLREEMQIELSLLLRRLGVTTILVTHDQREAFALADRVAVMGSGRIAQVGTPREMYDTPRDSYVLRFLGSVNTMPASLIPDGTGGGHVALGEGLGFAMSRLPAAVAGRGTALLHVRTEDIGLADAPTPVHTASPGTVALSTFLGAQERIVVTLGGQEVVIDRPVRAGEARPTLRAGQEVYLDLLTERCHLAPAE